MRLDEQWSIIDDFDIDILTMTSTAISIAKFNGSNNKQCVRGSPLTVIMIHNSSEKVHVIG